MVKEFKLPELGENIETADIVKIMVSPGDKVEVDQIVLEIETDKATIEVPSEYSGVVKEVFVKNGETAKVGQVIFTLEESAEESEQKSEPETKQTAEDPQTVEETQTTEPEPEVQTGEPAEQEGIIEFKLPDLGENIESAQIVKFLVKTGDKIENGQVLFELETDKATIEVPSELSGIVKEIKAKDGDTVKIGDVVMLIETTEMQKPVVQKVETDTDEKQRKPETERKREEPVQQISEERKSVPPSVPKRIGMPEKIAPAAPSVRRFAREIGIDINQVHGTGPGGRISVEDVKKFAKRINQSLTQSGGAPVGIKHEPLPDFTKWGEIEIQPMSNIRKKTAEHLSYAWATIPHVTQFDKADITEIEKLRKKYTKTAEAKGGKLTVTAIFLKIIASALKKFPQFNASIDMQKNEIIYKKYFNIGVAVDTDRGLIVPVIRDVDKKSVIDLSVELSEISAKARDKKITIDDMQGGNFTISNLGGIGGTGFTPIVNSPEVAILGVSRGQMEPVFKDGEFVPRLMLPISLSYDHRIIDGADAARFLRWVAQALEQPFLLILE